MKRIYKWLCLWAFRKWKTCEGEKMPVGVPYNRDPENPCEYYTPFRKQVGVGSCGIQSDCETDGHYLCKKCIYNIINQ